MRFRSRRALGIAAGLLLLVAAAVILRLERWNGGTIPDPHIFLPQGSGAAATIFIVSDADGWGADEAQAASALQAEGAIVIGVDARRYLAALEGRRTDECVYLVADIEALSRQVQRAFGTADYRLPVVAGRGLGGAIALAIAAQTPDSTIGGTVAVDPAAEVPLKRPLCTPADRRPDRRGEIYMLADGPLPDPVSVVLTPAAAPEARDHIRQLRASWPAIRVAESPGPAAAALLAALRPAPDPLAAGPLAELPLALLETTPASDAMAVVLSGDGGWRDLDKTIAEHLQAQGIPTVGLDSLRYFWSARTPAAIAADLTRIIDTLRARWKVRHVALIGYSFGADVLPSAILAMDKAHQEMLAQVSLLGLSSRAGFRISVGGWLGFLPSEGRATLPDLLQWDLARVQCFYGRDEADTACPALRGTAAELIATSGGHHFDGDYTALADAIAAGLTRRAAARN